MISKITNLNKNIINNWQLILPIIDENIINNWQFILPIIDNE